MNKYIYVGRVLEQKIYEWTWRELLFLISFFRFLSHSARVARRFIFKQNPPILVYIGRPWNYFLYILWPVGVLCGHFALFSSHLLCFEGVCYIFRLLVFCTKKNLATLHSATNSPLRFSNQCYHHRLSITSPVSLRLVLKSIQENNSVSWFGSTSFS
jgi:hypothetical protein